MNIVYSFVKLAIGKLYANLYPYCMEDEQFCFALTAMVVTVSAAIILWLAFKTVPDMVAGIIYRIEAEQRRRHRMKVLLRKVRERREQDKQKAEFEFEELNVA